MAIRLSTGTRNGLCGTRGIFELFNGGSIDLYTGSQPASADDAETGSKLATITSSSGTTGLDFGTAAGGEITKGAGVWSGIVGTAGVASWFRMRGAGGTSGSSNTAVRIDGNIGVSGSDMVVANPTLQLNSTFTVSVASITQPAQ